MHAARRPPAMMARLGYAGTLPFVGLAVAMWAVPGWQSWLQPALLDYGALILSFVGALHGGMALAGMAREQPGLEARMHAWSVVPCLVGWLALLVPSAWGTALLVAGFAMHWVQDLRLARRVGLPAGYLALRARLSLVACVSLLAAAAAVPIAYGLA